MEIPVGIKALEICQGNPWWKKPGGWTAKTVALRCRLGVASLQCDPVRSPRSPHRAVVKKGETWQDQDDATSQCPLERFFLLIFPLAQINPNAPVH